MSAKKSTFPYYCVKKGENLKSVCSKFKINATSLLLLNNLSPKEIKEGQIIKLPQNS